MRFLCLRPFSGLPLPKAPLTLPGLTSDPSGPHPVEMDSAFTHLGNHLISDSASHINAGGDDLSTIDPDETLLYGKFGGRAGLGSRRRNDDDDNETEVYDDDDDESLASVPVEGMKGLNMRGAEEERELPAHACAYVKTDLSSSHVKLQRY